MGAPVRSTAAVAPTLTTASVDGLIVTDDPLLETLLTRLITLSAQKGLPTLYGFSTAAKLGGLMSYSADFFTMWRHAAGYVDRIFRGTKPAELPVRQPAKFALSLNLKTAKALGLDLAPTLVARADEVIE